MFSVGRYPRGFGRRKPGTGIRVNGNHPAARGLVGCWLLNEGGGSAQDLSLTGATGTLNGTLVPAPGNFGRSARHFDGSSAFFALGAQPSIPSNFTLLAWIKTDAIGNHQAIVWDENGIVNGQYATRINTGGTFDFFFGGGGVGFATGYTLTAGVWHQIAYTRSGSAGNWSCSFYFDGHVSTDSPQTVTNNPAANPTNVNIGYTPAAAFNFQGTMDTVLLANRTWSATDIWQNYQDPYGFLQPRPSFLEVGAGAGVAPAGGVSPLTRALHLTPGSQVIPNYQTY